MPPTHAAPHAAPRGGGTTAGRVRRTVCAALLLAAGALVAPTPAHAAGEQVDIWLTTTSDSGGRQVAKGLEKQTPITFGTDGSGSGQLITVDEDTRYQSWVGGGASFTDTAAWLMKGSGALSESTRNEVMNKLFSTTDGIGVGFLRNPMGASDLARFNYNFDDTCCDLNDFSIQHDLADILPLTKQARQINPAVKVMASPWSAPGWMKDNGQMNEQGWLKAEHYGTYAQYFVKYIQAYEAQGVPIDYVSVSNEPNCCGVGNSDYPTMNWNGSGLAYFTKEALWPAFRAAGITDTKTMVHDWNWSDYNDFGSTPLADPAIRNDPLFGGIAWHGYGGDPSTQTQIHNQYPSVDAFDTEHSGGTWIANQQQEDMRNLIDYTRNWGRSWVKWSLALDQNMGPHNGGCDVCTGLITVHNGDGRHGQVDYTIEYYTMGHLTKFVKQGAQRIASTDGSVRNVAWRNPDGSKALVAYNDTGSAQPVKIKWGDQYAKYTLPARASATFTWSGTPGSDDGGGEDATGPITGLAGKCADVAGANSANGTAVQLYDCNGTAAQSWTVGSDGTIRALGKCLDVKDHGTADGSGMQLWDCSGGANQQWTVTAGRDIVNPAADKCLDVTGNSSANGTPLQIWSCTGAANQKWTTPGT